MKKRRKRRKLLREKQKIVERARRREVLKRRKKSKRFIGTALKYDVEEEIKKLKSADEQNKTQMHTSKLSPVQQLLQNPKMQRELKEEQNNDKSVI